MSASTSGNPTVSLSWSTPNNNGAGIQWYDIRDNDGDYWGVAPRRGGLVPQWPTAAGARVFGYLQVFPGLERLLQDLGKAPVCCLLYIPGLSPALREKYTSARMVFSPAPLDLAQVVQHAAWTISHASHNMLATSFQAGLPQLLIPRHQEQLFGALRLVQAGSAVLALQDQPTFDGPIGHLLADHSLARSAQWLRQRHAPFDPLQSRARLQSLLDAHLPPAAAPRA